MLDRKIEIIFCFFLKNILEISKSTNQKKTKTRKTNNQEKFFIKKQQKNIHHLKGHNFFCLG